ncbi:MAG: hypothetical protein MUD08_04810 [Cytophagales bacterium]|nr:hypothetical protein [Cytophagales bacterium]
MRTEKIIVVLFVLVLVLRVFDIPGTSALLILLLSTLSILYFAGAFYFFRDRHTKKQNMPISVVSGVFLSIVPIGVVFKLLYWSGAQVYLLVGSFTAAAFAVVCFLARRKASEELSGYYSNMIARTVVLFTVSVLLYFTSTATLIKIQYWRDPELAAHDDYVTRKFYPPQH